MKSQRDTKDEIETVYTNASVMVVKVPLGIKYFVFSLPGVILL